MASKLQSMIRGLATWYRTPAGLLSLGLIMAVVALAVVGLTTPALLLAVFSTAVVFPHKLMGERRDWATALEGEQFRVDSRIADLSAVVSDLEHKTRRLNAELSLAPTAEEISTWQQSVEASQMRANAEIHTELAACAERVQERNRAAERHSTGDVPGPSATVAETESP